MTKRSCIVPLVAAAVLISAPGCENSEAQQRAEIQKTIARVSEEFVLVSMADAEAAQVRLKGLAAELNAVGNGASGQRTAVALLSGSIRREMAGLGLSEVNRIERQQRQQREMIRSEAAAALRLDTLAGSRETLERSESRDFLRGERETAATGLSEYEARVAELDVPISERSDANQSDAARVTELKTEASRLRRSAVEQGRRTGMPSFEQAIQLEQEADRFEIEMARREGELRYNLQPEHDLASHRAAYYSGLIDEIDATTQTLSDRAQSTAAEASRTRDIQAKLRDTIAKRLEAINDTSQKLLQPEYAEVAANLDAAATKVRSASDDDARLALARIHLMQGQLHRGRAASLTDQAEVLSRLVTAGPALGDPAVFEAARADAEQAANAAMQDAAAAFTEAQSAIGQVRSKSPATQAFALEIDTALARVTGTETPERPAMEAPVAAQPEGMGAASPEELLSMLQSETGMTGESASRLLSLTVATTPDGQQMIAAQRRMVAGVAGLVQAMEQQFGVGSAEGLGGGFTGGMPGSVNAARWGQAQITDRTPDRVTLSMPGPLGETTAVFVAVNGRWYVDADVLVAMFPGVGARANEMAGQLESAFANLVRRVEAGEFSSIDDLQSAVLREMGEALGDSPGGTGGPGAGSPGQ